MMSASGQPLNVTIACGGTGGHLFPGLAVAERLALYGARVTLLISAKAVARLHGKKISVTGTPVRSKFQPMDARACRVALGLEAERPLVLVMGGSQGAHSVNELILRSMQLLVRGGFGWQWLHLSGPADV